MGTGLQLHYLWKVLFVREWVQINRGIQFFTAGQEAILRHN